MEAQMWLCENWKAGTPERESAAGDMKMGPRAHIWNFLLAVCTKLIFLHYKLFNNLGKNLQIC
jgi:hypothetical protein